MFAHAAFTNLLLCANGGDAVPLEVTMTLTSKWPVQKNTTLNQHKARCHTHVSGLVRATPPNASALRKNVPPIGTPAQHVTVSSLTETKYHLALLIEGDLTLMIIQRTPCRLQSGAVACATPTPPPGSPMRFE